MKTIILDVGVVIGAAVFVYGLAQAWRPLGFIVGGLLLAAGCFVLGYGLPGKGGRS